MTRREQTALAFVAVGAVLVLTAAYAYDGWRLVGLLAGVLVLALGVLLALDEPAPAPTALEAVFDDDVSPQSTGSTYPGSYPNPQDH